MCEQTVPQIGENAFTHPAGQVGLRRRERKRCDARGEESDDDPSKRMQIFLADSSVDRELREVRRRESDDRVAEQGDEGECRASRVRARQADERREAPPGPAPRPVGDSRTPLIRQMAPRLPDLHAEIPIS
jgi:hypothetical protein